MENSSWPLPTSLRTKLAAAGYLSVSDLHLISPSHLAQDIQISHEEASQILQILCPEKATISTGVKTNILSGAKTAWDLLCQEKTKRRIVTSCDELDAILGGGICQKELTEICGVPGVGKTQLGIQLAVNVQIPLEFGGVNGHAVYIDTEGSFMVERVSQMAQACLTRLGQAPVAGTKPLDSHINLDLFLSHIFYFRICDASEQIAVVNNLDSFLKSHKEVKLIVIDSVTFHFRHGFEDMGLRTRILGGMCQKLMRVAEVHDVAIVLMNQVTTRITGGSAKLIPALGESWSHACTNRVILFWNKAQRHAHIYKSPSLPSSEAPFSVCPEGIQSVNTSKRLKLSS